MKKLFCVFVMGLLFAGLILASPVLVLALETIKRLEAALLP